MKHAKHLQPEDTKRRARILRVAQREFLNEGFEGCSIDRIAAKAAVSKREVYRYFSSKKALFETVAHDVFERASRTMAEIPGANRSRRAILLRYAQGVLTSYSDRIHLQLVRTAVAAGRHFPKLATELQRERAEQPVRLGSQSSYLRIAASEPALSAVRLASLAIDGSRFLLGTPLPSIQQRAEMAEAAVSLYLQGYRGVESRRLPFASRPASSINGATRTVWGSSVRVPQERLTALQNVALEQFLKKGYRAVNLDQVAKMAGVSNATVYRHFGSKEGLFRHVIGERILEIDHTAPRVSAGGDPESAVASLAREILDWHVRPDSIALQRLMIEVAPTFPDLARALHDTLTGVAARSLQAVLRAHGQPPASDMAARTFRSLATLGPWLIEICATPTSAERHDLSQVSAQIFLQGMIVNRRKNRLSGSGKSKQELFPPGFDRSTL